MTFETIDTTGFQSAALADQPQPMMIWAKLDDLIIDRRYQRNITQAGRKAIQRIADGFDWRKYQPILVAPAEGGKFAVVDGQHRAHAAALCGIEELPAMTVPMTPTEQASGFAAINRDRIKMDPLSIYRAELHAGTEWAALVKLAVEAGNCTMATANPSQVNKKPGTLYCVNLIRKMFTNGEAEAVSAGLAAIRRSHSADDISSYSGPVLSIWLRAIATNQRFMKLDLDRVFDSFDFLHEEDTARLKSRQTGTPARTIVTDRLIEALKEWRAAA